MSNPVVGYDGVITIGGTSVTKAKKYSHKGARDKTETGPWIGDPNKVTVIGGKLGTIEVEGDVQIGGDPGVTALSGHFEAGTTAALVLTIEDGYTVTYAAPAFTAFEVEGDAGAGQTWKASAEGAYVLSQDA